ncbi:hypothetical protein ACFLSX_01140 [Calditrichota bacterium]
MSKLNNFIDNIAVGKNSGNNSNIKSFSNACPEVISIFQAIAVKVKDGSPCC